MAHHEAMSPSWTKSAWALVFVSELNVATVAASCFGVTEDCAQLSHQTAELGISVDGSTPGFHLWRGAVRFDGLDGIDYDGKSEKLEWNEAQVWMSKHEANPPIQDSDVSVEPELTL